MEPSFPHDDIGPLTATGGGARRWLGDHWLVAAGIALAIALLAFLRLAFSALNQITLALFSYDSSTKHTEFNEQGTHPAALVVIGFVIGFVIGIAIGILGSAIVVRLYMHTGGVRTVDVSTEMRSQEGLGRDQFHQSSHGRCRKKHHK